MTTDSIRLCAMQGLIFFRAKNTLLIGGNDPKLKEEFGMIWVGIGIGIVIMQVIAIVGNAFRVKTVEQDKMEWVKRLTTRLKKIEDRLDELYLKGDDQD